MQITTAAAAVAKHSAPVSTLSHMHQTSNALFCVYADTIYIEHHLSLIDQAPKYVHPVLQAMTSKLLQIWPPHARLTQLASVVAPKAL